jgi:hypothetical protein
VPSVTVPEAQPGSTLVKGETSPEVITTATS